MDGFFDDWQSELMIGQVSGVSGKQQAKQGVR
jgi:hypothetical protein